MVIEFISLLSTMAALKEMTGALAPFSYLVIIELLLSRILLKIIFTTITTIYNVN